MQEQINVIFAKIFKTFKLKNPTIAGLSVVGLISLNVVLDDLLVYITSTPSFITAIKLLVSGLLGGLGSDTYEYLNKNNDETNNQSGV